MKFFGKSFLGFFLSLVLVFTNSGFVFAGAWAPPTAGPPLGQPEAPLDQGVAPQAKEGVLGVKPSRSDINSISLNPVGRLDAKFLSLGKYFDLAENLGAGAISQGSNGVARLYFNGTQLLVSYNGGEYRPLDGGDSSWWMNTQGSVVNKTGSDVRNVAVSNVPFLLKRDGKASVTFDNVNGNLVVNGGTGGTSGIFRVGIGKEPAGGYALDVNGKVNAKEFCINGSCKASWDGAPVVTPPGGNAGTPTPRTPGESGTPPDGSSPWSASDGSVYLTNDSVRVVVGPASDLKAGYRLSVPGAAYVGALGVGAVSGVPSAKLEIAGSEDLVKLRGTDGTVDNGSVSLGVANGGLNVGFSGGGKLRLKSYFSENVSLGVGDNSGIISVTGGENPSVFIGGNVGVGGSGKTNSVVGSTYVSGDVFSVNSDLIDLNGSSVRVSGGNLVVDFQEIVNPIEDTVVSYEWNLGETKNFDNPMVDGAPLRIDYFTFDRAVSFERDILPRVVPSSDWWPGEFRSSQRMQKSWVEKSPFCEDTNLVKNCGARYDAVSSPTPSVAYDYYLVASRNKTRVSGGFAASGLDNVLPRGVIKNVVQSARGVVNATFSVTRSDPFAGELSGRVSSIVIFDEKVKQYAADFLVGGLDENHYYPNIVWASVYFKPTYSSYNKELINRQTRSVGEKSYVGGKISARELSLTESLLAGAGSFGKLQVNGDTIAAGNLGIGPNGIRVVDSHSEQFVQQAYVILGGGRESGVVGDLYCNDSWGGMVNPSDLGTRKREGCVCPAGSGEQTTMSGSGGTGTYKMCVYPAPRN